MGEGGPPRTIYINKKATTVCGKDKNTNIYVYSYTDTAEQNAV